MVDHFDARRRGLGLALAAGLVATTATTASAEEPHGCGGFKWSLTYEAGLLLAPGNAAVANGAALAFDGMAVELRLVDFDAAGLPMAPERGPKNKPSKAGFLRIAAPPTAGPYQITLSQAAWIDVVQDGHYVKPTAFSGALDCPGVRKSIRVTLAASQVTLQISGTDAASIGIVSAPMP